MAVHLQYFASPKGCDDELDSLFTIFYLSIREKQNTTGVQRASAAGNHFLACESLYAEA